MSTTYSEKALHKWMKVNPSDNVVLKIYSKTGKIIEASSSLTKEAEVLLNTNKLFEVQKIDKGVRHPTIRNTKITEIILKEK